jgi:putative membrane protein
MKHLILIATSVAALGLAGCSKSADRTGEDTAANTEAVAGQDTSAPAAAVASPGQAFANTAAASDAFEIETSKLAETNASSAKVKSFAKEMIKAHTDSTAKLTSAAAAASPPITPVASLSAAQQETLQSLSSRTGTAFDQAYAKAQVDAHQTALDGLKSYSATGDVASLKTFATEVVPVVTAHLNMAKGL